MKEHYLYFSVTPEALIASGLEPDKFGSYLAVGTQKRARGQAVFFELDIDKLGDIVDKKYVEENCVSRPDGTPKRTLYLSIYRVMERIPLEALKGLYLATDDGRVLKLEQSEFEGNPTESLHLYQELCPVTPRIASTLNPTDFVNFVCDAKNKISVPKLLCVQLELGELANDPIAGKADDLPYSNIYHIRDCLAGLLQNSVKFTKTVTRFFNGDIQYRTVKNGFFIGDKDKCLFYKFPSREELDEKHHSWWRSALTHGFK
ncbi:MAG: hypothetical protein MI975_18830 [Cytophagales bacterium]|nr:hypothetical protein [Cytophagales bacterium]